MKNLSDTEINQRLKQTKNILTSELQRTCITLIANNHFQEAISLSLKYPEACDNLMEDIKKLSSFL